MPSRAKKGQVQKKVSQLLDADGWTHVVRGARHNLALNYASTPLQATEGGSKITLDDLVKTQQKYVETWSSSTCCKQLRQILDDEILPTSHLQIRNCVCLGIGSLTDGRLASKHQMATLIWVLGVLRQRHQIEEVFFQDPAFGPSDVVYLESLGYHVLESPLAFEKIDESSFLFAPHLEGNLYATGLSKQVPALTIGSNIAELLDRPITSNVDLAQRDWESHVFQRFKDTMSAKAMPQYDRNNWYYFTGIYWRNDMVSEETEQAAKQC